MCRNIKTLHDFEPPATALAIESAALQFVRKLAGCNKLCVVNRKAFSVVFKKAFSVVFSKA